MYNNTYFKNNTVLNQQRCDFRCCGVEGQNAGIIEVTLVLCLFFKWSMKGFLPSYAPFSRDFPPAVQLNRRGSLH